MVVSRTLPSAQFEVCLRQPLSHRAPLSDRAQIVRLDHALHLLFESCIRSELRSCLVGVVCVRRSKPDFLGATFPLTTTAAQILKPRALILHTWLAHLTLALLMAAPQSLPLDGVTGIRSSIFWPSLISVCWRMRCTIAL